MDMRPAERRRTAAEEDSPVEGMAVDRMAAEDMAAAADIVLEAGTVEVGHTAAGRELARTQVADRMEAAVAVGHTEAVAAAGHMEAAPEVDHTAAGLEVDRTAAAGADTAGRMEAAGDLSRVRCCRAETPARAMLGHGGLLTALVRWVRHGASREVASACSLSPTANSRFYQRRHKTGLRRRAAGGTRPRPRYFNVDALVAEVPPRTRCATGLGRTNEGAAAVQDQPRQWFDAF